MDGSVTVLYQELRSSHTHSSPTRSDFASYPIAVQEQLLLLSCFSLLVSSSMLRMFSRLPALHRIYLLSLLGHLLSIASFEIYEVVLILLILPGLILVEKFLTPRCTGM